MTDAPRTDLTAADWAAMRDQFEDRLASAYDPETCSCAWCVSSRNALLALDALARQQEANARLREQIEITRAAMEANLALPLHEHATDVTRLITESAYGNGTLSIVGVWDVASLTSDKLEQLRTRGEREFVYAHAFDALLTNQPEWTEAFGGLTVNDIAQHMKMQTAEVIEERYQRGRAEAALADRDAEIARLTAALAAAQFDRDEAIKDFRFGVHHDCRPNRKQAESWRDQLRDETDRHADTKAALADRDATIARLREVMQRAADALESDSTLEQRVAAWDAIADCFEPALTPAKEADRG